MDRFGIGQLLNFRGSLDYEVIGYYEEGYLLKEFGSGATSRVPYGQIDEYRPFNI